VNKKKQKAVIASAAKQSIKQKEWIASSPALLAMTENKGKGRI
jgi:hypothetical protein